MATRLVDSPYAWVRLGISLLLSTIGGVGMWSVVVALPAVQAEFGVARGGASLPFTLTMIGFGVGSVLMGRWTDTAGILGPVLGGSLALATGYLLASYAQTLLQFAVVYGLLIGLGTSATFAPLLADISQWFERRRGIAVALCASGTYLAGTFWPPVIEALIRLHGWRATHLGIGLCCLVAMLPLLPLLRRRAAVGPAGSLAPPGPRLGTLGFAPRVLQGLLALAGLSCCVAMAMPQVHLVAYCSDLGYGVTHGARMLALMLACGIVSRVASGCIADWLGGLVTLVLGSVAQMIALACYLLTDGLGSLYLISALFGLSQGGLVPSYALVIRECFPAHQAGGRVGVVMMMTLLGMALGGWMSGALFDLTGSYRAAFAHGVAWNALNTAIALVLLVRSGWVARARGLPRAA